MLYSATCLFKLLNAFFASMRMTASVLLSWKTYAGSSHPEISSSPESSASPAALHLRETRVRRCSVCCSACDEEDDEDKEEDEETKVFGAREIEQEDESRDSEVEKPAALPETEALPGSTKFWQRW